MTDSLRQVIERPSRGELEAERDKALADKREVLERLAVEFEADARAVIGTGAKAAGYAAALKDVAATLRSEAAK